MVRPVNALKAMGTSDFIFATKLLNCVRCRKGLSSNGCCFMSKYELENSVSSEGNVLPHISRVFSLSGVPVGEKLNVRSGI